MKRKAGGHACYAVAVGRAPGIYETWEATKAQVHGFSGAIFKGFPSRLAAQSFIASLSPLGHDLGHGPGEARRALSTSASSAAALPAPGTSSTMGMGKPLVAGSSVVRRADSIDIESEWEALGAARTAQKRRLHTSSASAGTAAGAADAAGPGRPVHHEEAGGGGASRAAATSAAAAPAAHGSRSFQYVLRFDGGARGNPGVAGAGAALWSITHEGASASAVGPEVLLWEGGVYYPHATNNFVSTTDTPNERALMCFMAQAEYQGLLLGLRRALAFGITRLHVEGDSLLVVNQVNGSWQVSTTPTYL